MGFVGELNRTEVKERVEQGIRRIVATGKVAGLLTADPAFARHCQELGARLVAVGTDAGLLARAADALAKACAASLIADGTRSQPERRRAPIDRRLGRRHAPR